MKKLILVLAIGLYAFHSQAVTSFKYDEAKIDTTQLSKQINKLNLKLADLNNQLINTRNQVPFDSVKLQSLLNKSRDAQVKSRKRSEQAVGGDMDDVKLAEKQAKRATRQTGDAEDAAKQLERDRKKEKKLLKQIEKTRKKLTKAQMPRSWAPKHG
ncbi:MAG: hypothetical protein JWP37_3015 [Mucilaginibacter sp.]|nr:hypothetical protein [Mucilaginibacter sp.]